MASQEIRSVLVTNISPSANEKTVSDFFSFCGKISKLYLKKEEGKDTNSAVIQFETESAAKTALLLTNALIVDRPITVTAYLGSSSTTTDAAAEPTPDPIDHGTPIENISHKDFGGVADDQRSKTSVIASLLAAGYVLTENALDKAKELDEKSNFSNRAKVTVDQMKAKVQEIDTQLGISEKAKAVQTAVNETAKKIDNELGLSEKASIAAQVIKTGAQAGMAKIQENSTVKQGVEAVKRTAGQVSDAANNTFNSVKAETNTEISRREAQQGHPHAATTEAPAPVSMETQQQ
eukprot:TRINITY_DN24914_c0_g1_i1.p2 TRINITY_DN24914_c0_g1~~TRINITY_DN24914_c0_g1_i1.p2  ORF type:complete len:292 (-),score=95.85 TRINITY_DN24914_c0_g1_i1:1123-1998(-)